MLILCDIVHRYKRYINKFDPPLLICIPGLHPVSDCMSPWVKATSRKKKRKKKRINKLTMKQKRLLFHYFLYSLDAFVFTSCLFHCEPVSARPC